MHPLFKSERKRRLTANDFNKTNREERMPRRIVDISVALKAGIASDPPYMLP